MYTISSPTPRSTPYSVPIGAAAAAYALLGSTLSIGGTGSVFEISRAEDWRRMVEARVPLRVTIGVTEVAAEWRPDVRSPAEHLANIRQTLNPAVADLASAFGVSRQAIYKWIGGEATPEADKLERIRSLSLAADAFREAGVTRASALVKIKAFEGRSLMDLVADGQPLSLHVQALVDEARAMDAAHDRSALAKSKAKPTEDWRASASVPGSPE